MFDKPNFILKSLDSGQTALKTKTFWFFFSRYCCKNTFSFTYKWLNGRQSYLFNCKTLYKKLISSPLILPVFISKCFINSQISLETCSDRVHAKHLMFLILRLQKWLHSLSLRILDSSMLFEYHFICSIYISTRTCGIYCLCYLDHRRGLFREKKDICWVNVHSV